jgi:hypothetical protein
VGGSAQAQAYLDKLLAVAAKRNGWESASGSYFTDRARAMAYLDQERPHFGILSLGAFLALRASRRLFVIGEVSVSAPGGRQYFMVSKSAPALAACKGQKLASDHLAEARFIDKVVAAGAFRTTDFQAVETRRPVQTLKEVIRDRATCALIDDAQLEAARNVEGGDLLKVVWKSEKLPDLPVVAFETAGAKRAERFKRSLGELCQGEGAEACRSVGIVSLRPSSGSSYAAIEAAYSR